MSDTYTRFRLALIGDAIVARGYRPEWWQQIVGSVEQTRLLGFDIRSKRIYATAENSIPAPPVAMCIAPDLPGARAAAPFAPTATQWRVYVLTNDGAVRVLDRETLEPQSIALLGQGTQRWLVPGMHGIMVPGDLSGELLYYAQDQALVLDSLVLPGAPIVDVLWTYNPTRDLFLALHADGSLDLLEYLARDLRLRLAVPGVVRAPGASLVDLRSFVVNTPDAWPWYGPPDEAMLLTAGPLGQGQTTTLDIEDPDEVTVQSVDRDLAPYTELSRVGAAGTRSGTELDAGLFPDLEPWYPLTRLIAADPGLDRISRFMAIQGRQGDVIIGGQLTDSQALLAAFLVVITRSGTFSYTAAGGEMEITTTIPYIVGEGVEKTSYFIDGVITVANFADIANAGGFLRGVLKTPLNPGEIFSMVAGCLSFTSQADTYVFATAQQEWPPAYFTADGVATQWVTTVDFDAAVMSKTGSADTSTVWVARNRWLIDSQSFTATAGQTQFNTTLPFTGFSRSVNSIVVRKNGVKLASSGSNYTVTNNAGNVRVTLAAGAALNDNVTINGQNIYRFSTTATIANVGGKLAVNITGVLAGEIIEVIPFKAKRAYTVPGTGAKTLRLRIRGYFEACGFSGGTRIDPVYGNPGRCYKNVTLGGGTPDALFLAVGADTYLLNARGVDPATMLNVPLYDVYDYVVDIPVTGGQVVTTTYDIRADVGVRSALPLTNRQAYIPADDDPGLPLVTFDPSQPVAGISIQVDILRILD